MSDTETPPLSTPSLYRGTVSYRTSAYAQTMGIIAPDATMLDIQAPSGIKIITQSGAQCALTKPVTVTIAANGTAEISSLLNEAELSVTSDNGRNSNVLKENNLITVSVSNENNWGKNFRDLLAAKAPVVAKLYGIKSTAEEQRIQQATLDKLGIACDKPHTIFSSTDISALAFSALGELPAPTQQRIDNTPARNRR